ncbi:28S ribosomal protein S5, mitochondrial-like [Oncorhynchus keta]|uniref:28S ribosomal protein S5, mitochondrial-like n=1 Tax=Oncorhynchus keta TaxID=8018 RepID=UPI00227C7375|nr:28S ribosomal protein S5, mitochondrial-like [Oncorhynchus keta]
MRVKRERGWTGNSWGGISLGPPDPGPNGGYGLHCHRAVITICKLIEDMYAKEEGSVNLLNITMALFTRLANQRPNSFCLVSFSRSAGPCPSSWPPLRIECILTTNPRKRQDMKRMTGTLRTIDWQRSPTLSVSTALAKVTTHFKEDTAILKNYQIDIAAVRLTQNNTGGEEEFGAVI